MHHWDCFKKYDIRGAVPEVFNVRLAASITEAYLVLCRPARVVIGYDARRSSPEIAERIVEVCLRCGVDVLMLGMTATELLYFAVAAFEYDGGIMITASHNPAHENGLKLVEQGAQPFSRQGELEALVRQNFSKTVKRAVGAIGSYVKRDLQREYVDFVLRDLKSSRVLRPLHLLFNPGNGVMGPLLKHFEEGLRKRKLPITCSFMHANPNSLFPHGMPNPLQKDQQQDTGEQIAKVGAELGIAFDGDGDRVFFFDENGKFVPSCYSMGIFIETLLKNNHGGAILYDARLRWYLEELITKHGGRAVICCAGHSEFKRKMRTYRGIYGGEVSGHHYFDGFWGCDSSLFATWLMVNYLISQPEKYSTLLQAARSSYPILGEINLRPMELSVEAIQWKLCQLWGDDASSIDRIDGLSIAFSDWRFNLRASHTEQLMRVNLEGRCNPEQLSLYCESLLALLKTWGGVLCN